jgi:hypothetical protein
VSSQLPGNDLTGRFPLIVKGVAELRSHSCIIDGEAVACGPDGIASFELIRSWERIEASSCMPSSYRAATPLPKGSLCGGRPADWGDFPLRRDRGFAPNFSNTGNPHGAPWSGGVYSSGASAKREGL